MLSKVTVVDVFYTRYWLPSIVWLNYNSSLTRVTRPLHSHVGYVTWLLYLCLHKIMWHSTISTYVEWVTHIQFFCASLQPRLTLKHYICDIQLLCNNDITWTSLRQLFEVVLYLLLVAKRYNVYMLSLNLSDQLDQFTCEGDGSSK